MHLTYVNGTPQQRTWLEEALAWTFDIKFATVFDPEVYDVPRFGEPPHTHDDTGFPFQAFPSNVFRLFIACACQVTVEWVPESQIPTAAGSDGHIIFAHTETVGITQWFQSDIKIAETLDTRGGAFGGEKFYKETVLHEFMHVLQALLGEEGKAKVIAAFGGGSWSGGAWEDQIQEAAAETMKDLLAGEDQRRYSNRTHKRLPYNNLLDLFRPFYTGPPEEWGIEEYLPEKGTDPMTEESVGIVTGGPQPEIPWQGDWINDFNLGAIAGSGNPPHGAQYGSVTGVPLEAEEADRFVKRWDCSATLPGVAGMLERIGVTVFADFPTEGFIWALHRVYDADDNLVGQTDGLGLWDFPGYLWDGFLPPNLNGRFLGRRFFTTDSDWNPVRKGAICAEFSPYDEAFGGDHMVKLPLRYDTRIAISASRAIQTGGAFPTEGSFPTPEVYFQHSVESSPYYFVPQYPDAAVPGVITAVPAGAGNRPRKPTRGSASPGVVLG